MRNSIHTQVLAILLPKEALYFALQQCSIIQGKYLPKYIQLIIYCQDFLFKKLNKHFSGKKIDNMLCTKREILHVQIQLREYLPINVKC